MNLSRRDFIQLSTVLAVAGVHRLSSAETSNLDTLVLEAMERNVVPGLSLATIRDGAIAYQGSYGLANAETDLPVTDSTAFEAASLTKPLLALVAMRLVQDGLLDLDRPLVKYREPKGEFRRPKWMKQITARHVLSHSTGFPNWHSSSRPVPQRHVPGEAFGYSGMAYVMLQRVVEEIVGVPFEAYVAQNLFKPLAMESASLVWRDDYDTRLAHGHLPTGKPSCGKMTQSNAASSLVCDASDYARIITQLMNNPVGNPLSLSENSLDTMLIPHKAAATNVAWGLGWGIQQGSTGDTYFHWGNNGNRYHAFVVWSRSSRDGVVIMTNSGNGLKLCADLVPQLMPADHTAFTWGMVVPQPE